MSDPFLCVDKKNLECQRHIYIVDILNKHFVSSPSFLRYLPLSFLKEIAYSSQLFILDPKDFFNDKLGIPQFGFLVH